MSSRNPEGDLKEPGSESEPPRTRQSTPSQPGLTRAVPVYGTLLRPSAIKRTARLHKFVVTNPPFGERHHLNWSDYFHEPHTATLDVTAAIPAGEHSGFYIDAGHLMASAHACISPYGRMGHLPELLRPLRQQEPAIRELRIKPTPEGPKVYIAVDQLDTERDRRIIEFLLQVETDTGEILEYAFVSPETIRVVAADGCPVP